MNEDQVKEVGIDPRSREIAESLLSLRNNQGWLIMLDEIDNLVHDCVDQMCLLTNDPDTKSESVERAIYKLAVRVDDLKWFKARMADLIVQGTTPEEREKLIKVI